MGRVIVPKDQVTQKLIRETFDYFEGNLIWVKPKARWLSKGDKVGCQRSDGYIVTNVFGRNYLLHRLIWFWHFGDWPKLLDHIDQNRSNNRIENLRSVNKRINVYNTDKLWSHNTSGIRGVSWDSKNKKWTARFKCNGKYEFLGYFDSKEDAQFSRQQAERSLGQ